MTKDQFKQLRITQNSVLWRMVMNSSIPSLRLFKEEVKLNYSRITWFRQERWLYWPVLSKAHARVFSSVSMSGGSTFSDLLCTCCPKQKACWNNVLFLEIEFPFAFISLVLPKIFPGRPCILFALYFLHYLCHLMCPLGSLVCCMDVLYTWYIL